MKYIITPNTTKEELIEKGFIGYTEEEYADMLKPYEVNDTDLINAFIPTASQYFDTKEYHHCEYDTEPYQFLFVVSYLDDKYIPEVYWNDYRVEKIEVADNKIWFICNHYDHFDKTDNDKWGIHTRSPIKLDASRCIRLLL